MESGRQAIKKDESFGLILFITVDWILILSFQNPCILEVWSVFCFDCIAAVRSIGFVIETGDDHTKHALFVFSQKQHYIRRSAYVLSKRKHLFCS